MDELNAGRSRRKNVSRVNYAEDKYEEKNASVYNESKGSSATSGNGKMNTKVIKAESSSSSSSSSSPSKKNNSSNTNNNKSARLTPTNGTPTVGEQDEPEKFSMNWQRKITASELASYVLDLKGAKMVKGILHLKNGVTLGPEDHIYILSDPPGEPYYIGRIMEFIHKKKEEMVKGEGEGEVEGEGEGEGEGDDNPNNYRLRINWLYRPKDISKHVSDSRLLYATMHSDILSLQSIRGKCTVKLKDHISNMTEYRATPDCFWFDKLYDRYILRFYEVVATEKITNIPKKMYDILTSRFKYAIVEIGRGKDLCGTPKNCEKCGQWCSPDDSVQCAHCKEYYHMLCLDPPLTRKPTRGFGWSCAKCSGALERRLEENKGILTNRISFDAIVSSVSGISGDAGNSAATDATTISGATATTTNTTNEPTTTNTSSNNSSRSPSTQPLSRYEELEAALSSEHVKKQLTKEQEHQLRLWPFRYLGVHSKMEDILDTDDRIYPRAASRLGNKHQATVLDWPGRPIIYYEPEKIEKKGKKGTKSKSKVDSSTPNEDTPPGSNTPISIPKKERPPWMQEKFPGYIERGGESTSTLLWKMPDEPDASEKVDKFLLKTHSYAEKLSIAYHSPNFVDACLQAYMSTSYNDSEALEIISTFTRKSLKEPTFTAQEKKRFEDAVRKYGSELYPVYKEVKSKKSADIVRYYYLWKKTPSGHEIWDNYEGRKGKKKQVQTTDDGLVDEVADSADDSAYDNQKIKRFNRQMCCKFCSTTTSQAWRRAPGYPVAGNDNPIIALCIRCARLWKKYAVQWENPDEVIRKMNMKSGNGTKRKVEGELIEDAKSILNERDSLGNRKKIKLEKPVKEKVVSQSATPSPVTIKKNTNKKVQSQTQPQGSNEDTKKIKPATTTTSSSTRSKSVKSESGSRNSSPGDSPLSKLDDDSDVDMIDDDIDDKSSDKDKEFKFVKSKTPTEVTTTTSSVLSRPCAVCSKLDPVSEQLFCQSCALNVHRHCYGEDQLKTNTSWLCDTCSNDLKPFISTVYACRLCPVRSVTFYKTENSSEDEIIPSDTVKRTFDNNWAHIRCSMFIPEVKFGNPKTMQPIEDIWKIPPENFKETCTLCGTVNGACTSCSVCSTSFHVGCAFRHHYKFGFTLQPKNNKVKGKVIKFGDKSGILNAIILCSGHTSPKLIGMYEIDSNTGKTALQIYCEEYKEADNQLTGAMKRATLYSIKSTKSVSNESTTPSTSLGTSAKNLALVLSSYSDLYNSEFPCNQTNCQHCGYKKATYWVETETDSKEKKIICPPCYWKAKDREAFNEAFDNEKISLINNEISTKNLETIQEILKRRETNPPVDTMDVDEPKPQSVH